MNISSRQQSLYVSEINKNISKVLTTIDIYEDQNNTFVEAHGYDFDSDGVTEIILLYTNLLFGSSTVEVYRYIG